MIDIHDVSKIYQMGNVKVAALQNVNLTVLQGEMLAIMGPSAGQLIINRTAAPGMSDLAVGLLFVLPLASFLAANMLQWQVTSRWEKITPRRAEPGFLVLGIGAFSLVLPGILLAIMAEDRIGTIGILVNVLS